MELSKLARVNAQEDVPFDEMEEAIEEVFRYHPWSTEQRQAGEYVKKALMTAYVAILVNVPSCPSRTRALNMLTDCRMLANRAITFQGDI